MKLFVVRHGQTDWNKNKRLQGQVDIELNQTGIDSASRLAAILSSIDYDMVISSPLSRALKTAQLFNDAVGCKYNIVQEPRLIERSFGSSEGMHYQKVEEIQVKDDFESDEALTSRILNTILELKSRGLKNVLIFTHVHVTMQILKQDPEILDPTQMTIENCGVLEFEICDEIKLISIK